MLLGNIFGSGLDDEVPLPLTTEPPMDDPTKAMTSESASATADPRAEAMIEVFGPEFFQRFNEPVVFMSAELYSPVAQSMMRRDFALLSRSLLLESVYRRRMGFSTDVLDSFEVALKDKLAQVTHFYSLRNEQILRIFSTQSITPESSYIKVQQYPHIPIIATHARSFVHMLKLMDGYYQLTGCAKLMGLMDGSQARTAELQARKIVRAFLAVVRQEAIKLRRESNRLKAMSTGDVGDDVRQAEMMMDTAVQEHAADAASAGLDHVPDDEAAAVLDGIAATGSAAAKAGGRARKAEPELPLAAAA